MVKGSAMIPRDQFNSVFELNSLDRLHQHRCAGSA